MIVQKYGGSSLKNTERIQAVSAIIKKSFEQRNKADSTLIVVVSAVGGITDLLIECGNEQDHETCIYIYNQIQHKHITILRELGLDITLLDPIFVELKTFISEKDISSQSLDVIQGFGERLSSTIISAYLNSLDVPSTQHNAYDIGFVTNDEFGNAEILRETYKNIRDHLSHFRGVPIITGFIAKNKSGHRTTLGRGGSDYTAAIIGAALDVDEVQIWSDVNGIMTADPRIVSEARTLSMISFEEATELAYFGTKVLHPKTIIPLMRKNIPVQILNTYEPEHVGTRIVNKLDPTERHQYTAIACKKFIQVVNVKSMRMLDAHGFLAKLFEVFGRHKVAVDMLATSEVSVSITVDDKADLAPIVEELITFSTVTVHRDKAIICIVGDTYKRVPGIGGKIFTILGEENISVEMISHGASEISVSFVIDVDDLERAVHVLHNGLFAVKVTKLVTKS